MAKSKETHTEKFLYEYLGRKYDCERTISGSRTFSQTIHVIGVGSKVDSAMYGPNIHPVESMLSIARIIAGEIIREAEGRAGHSRP